MNVLTFDFETTIYNKGSPFDKRNKAICLAYKWKHEEEAQCLDLTNEIGILAAQQLFEQADWLVGFNCQFDLHWAANIGCSFRHCRILDVQLAEFLLKNQTTPYPSLNGCAEEYLGESKLDIVASEYWDKGIDTDQIPTEILYAYAKQDVLLTEKLAILLQEKLVEQRKWKLFCLQMDDLLVLQDMVWNGMLYDKARSIILAKETEEKIKEIKEELLGTHIYGNYINLASGDHLSAYLYGGTITHEERIPNGVWKTGQKAGQTRYKTVEYELKFDRQFEPIKGSELKKEGFYATDEKTLRKLKGTKEKKHLIEQLLKLSELEKLHGTYYKGLVDTMEEAHWDDGLLHGQLNMCVTRTGRLSSSKPNMQNMAGDIKELFITRYK